MPIAVDLAIVAATAIAAEGMAWAVHRFVMHGWGWPWHNSHHRRRDGVFEKNDLYAVVFAVFAFLLMLTGAIYAKPLYWIGLGLTVYGLLYFLLHDGLVHRRWPLRVTPRSPYLLRLVQAHHLHHAVHEREGAVSFGFLYAPPVRRLREQLRRNMARSS